MSILVLNCLQHLGCPIPFPYHKLASIQCHSHFQDGTTCYCDFFLRSFSAFGPFWFYLIPGHSLSYKQSDYVILLGIVLVTLPEDAAAADLLLWLRSLLPISAYIAVLLSRL